jgi:hypothetical protein
LISAVFDRSHGSLRFPVLHDPEYATPYLLSFGQRHGFWSRLFCRKLSRLVGELSKLVSHLMGRLSGTEDGKPKIFRDSAVENLTEFFNRFRQLNVRSNEQLDGLVNDAHRIVRGVVRLTIAAIRW